MSEWIALSAERKYQPKADIVRLHKYARLLPEGDIGEPHLPAHSRGSTGLAGVFADLLQEGSMASRSLSVTRLTEILDLWI